MRGVHLRESRLAHERTLRPSGDRSARLSLESPLATPSVATETLLSDPKVELDERVSAGATVLAPTLSCEDGERPKAAGGEVPLLPPLRRRVLAKASKRSRTSE